MDVKWNTNSDARWPFSIREFNYLHGVYTSFGFMREFHGKYAPYHTHVWKRKPWKRVSKANLAVYIAAAGDTLLERGDPVLKPKATAFDWSKQYDYAMRWFKYFDRSRQWRKYRSSVNRHCMAEGGFIFP